MRDYLRRAILACGILLTLFVGGVKYATDNILPYSPIRPHRCTGWEMARYAPDRFTPAGFGVRWENFDITVEDSICLRGWFIHGRGPGRRGTIFLLHGIASCRSAMLGEARSLVEEGFNCILYDSRAHGESGGLNCTFGYYEKRDLSAYIDSAESRYPGSSPYGVFGVSFGAATAIEALAWDRRLACGVAESPFATLRGVIHAYFRQMFILPFDWIPDAALVNTERIARFQVDSVNPASDARSIVQPTMIIHGVLDGKISPADGKRIYDNLASPQKELYLVDGAGHDDIALVGGAGYARRVIGFFHKYLVPVD